MFDRSKCIDWYLASAGDSKNLPKSHGDSIYWVKSQFAPLMAAVALLTGRKQGDVEALTGYVEDLENQRYIVCQSCGQSLDRFNGHESTCKLKEQAFAVISGRSSVEKEKLLAEQKKLQEKAERTKKMLDALEIRENQS